MDARDGLFIHCLTLAFAFAVVLFVFVGIVLFFYRCYDRYFASYRPRSNGDIYADQDSGFDSAAYMRIAKPLDFALRYGTFMAGLTDEQRAVFKQHSEKPGVDTMFDLLVSLESSEDSDVRDLAFMIRQVAG